MVIGVFLDTHSFIDVRLVENGGKGEVEGEIWRWGEERETSCYKAREKLNARKMVKWMEEEWEKETMVIVVEGRRCEKDLRLVDG